MILHGYVNPWTCECGCLLRGITNKEDTNKRSPENRNKMDKNDFEYVSRFSIYECPSCHKKNAVEDGISFFWDCIHPESNMTLKDR